MELTFFVFVLLLAGVHAKHPQCRCSPGDKCWPDTQAWNDFNTSVHGQLIVVTPPAWPCHDPHYDQKACKTAMDSWSNSFWRADQPGAMMESNWEWALTDNDTIHGCFIRGNRSSPCYQGSVPLYAVNVTEASHVQLAVKFASRHSLRLVIRNTGHDYIGRSTAKGALSIWLHHLRDIEFHDGFIPDGCDNIDATSAVTVGAGVQWEPLYREATKHGVVIVGAGGASVGAAGGHPQGGGHSPISPAFGLAADNILEYKVVTADGKLRTANKCQNKDLFWALCGGGGGTFGVVLSATHKTHPAFSSLVFAGYTATASNASGLQQLLTVFAKMNPSLSDDGWSGYFQFQRQPYTLTIIYILPNRGESFANKSLTPFVLQMKENAIELHGGILSYASFEEWFHQIICNASASCEAEERIRGTGGSPAALASRLIPKDVLESSPASVAQALVKILETPQAGFLGALVAGGKVSEPRDNAVNPAWRRATWHLVLSTTWNDNATVTEQNELKSLVTTLNKLLIDITPGSGSYMNEADYNEPNYKFSFYGENYKRLYRIKQKVDPNGLFICHHCVASEDWTPDMNCKIK